MLSSRSGGTSSLHIRFQGSLGPGMYTLSMEAHASEYWGASVDVTGELVVIPTPAAAALMVGALFVPLSSRRRS